MNGSYLQLTITMRLKIEIDNRLMNAAMAAGDFKTQKDAIEEGLRRVVRTKVYQNIRALRGKLQWSLDGDWTTSPSEVQNTSVSELNASCEAKIKSV